ncbi:MAG TPA: SDR family oxidoreductase [Steroidobacteraceae bacterium]|nr:SDR family oxidoreductase [Steroidobacteraceae bacterium]
MSKVIVITGAGAGLGRTLARRLAADGEHVVLLGRTAAKVEKVAAELGGKATAVACDVASPDSVKAAFKTIASSHPKIDVLINCAAIYEPFLVADATDAQISSILLTNLAGPIYCSRAAIPSMARGGHIINVSSESVDLPFPHLLLYQSSKAGLERFSQGLHRELEPTGIRVTTVRAGQMADADKTVDWDPKAAMAFAQAALAAGLNLRERPISQFTSVTSVFRTLIDLPADLQVTHMTLAARSSA